jgi:hypothetical protein
VRVHIRSIAAQCPKCRAEDFHSSTGRHMPLAPDATLRCLACGSSATYIELIVQIAEKARERSQAMLEEMRQKRSSDTSA